MPAASADPMNAPSTEPPRNAARIDHLAIGVQLIVQQAVVAARHSGLSLFPHGRIMNQWLTIGYRTIRICPCL